MRLGFFSFVCDVEKDDGKKKKNKFETRTPIPEKREGREDLILNKYTNESKR